MQKPWHSISSEKTFHELKTRPEGLSQKEAEEKLKEFGPNKLPEERPYSRLRLFLRQFESPLIYILFIAGLITLFIKEYIDMSVIFGVVAINTIIGFIQENKASQVLLKLKTLVRNKAIVIRGNNQKEIDIYNLTAGDIIILRPGDKVPADSRLIEADNLKINEAILTGEWLAAHKHTETLAEKTPLADRDNMVFMGTIVEEGWGKAIVTATGLKTELGQIAFLTRKTKEEKTPFQKKLAHLGRIIGLIISLISLFILIIGLAAGHQFLEMFMTSVAIAVSAIPEGLPVAMTVVLAIGMQRILKRKGLTKTLLGVETLGSTSIICTDKTGSLTEGKMKVVEIISQNKELILKIITLCNESFIENPEQTMDKWVIRGRPTGRALLLASVSAGLNKNELEAQAPRLEILPFTPERKYIATLHKEADDYFLYLVGAPEKILEKSIFFETDRYFEKLTLGKFKTLKEQHEELTKQGLRVVATGYKKVKKQELKGDNIEKLCQDIVFAGFVALKDPLRPEVKEAISLCKQAGLRPIIVTGDHRLTAQAIAQELDLPAKKENILEGYQLDLMSDKEFQKKVKMIEIYARVDPKHKMRIIEAWQKQGEVVAMTGDGVNDAPALKKADIGVALGSGTDVAKEASDLILLNNNFSIIVAAIEEGRVILDNLKKIIVYLLSDSMSEVVLIGGSLLLGLPLPLIPVQILWVNLIADSLPNMALAFEKKEKDIMKRRPQAKKTSLLDKRVKTLILIMGTVTSLILLGLFLWLFKNTNDLAYIRTMIFAALGIDSLFYVFSCKSLNRPIWRINPFSNKYLVASVFIGFVMMGLAIYLPGLQTLLRTVSLGLKEWSILLTIGLLNIAAIEIVKWWFIVKKQDTNLRI